MKNQRSTVTRSDEQMEEKLQSDVTSDESTASVGSSGDLSSCSPESESLGLRLQAFVTLLIMKVLKKLGVQNHSLAEQVELIKTLQKDIMDGLNVQDAFCPKTKSIKKLCRAVATDVQEQLHARRVQDALIALKDPSVDHAIVQAIKTHVEDFSQLQVAEASKEPPWWRRWQDLLAGSIGTALLTVFIVAACV
ncbi:uncharacterized protein V6R79_000659 [Siganus canaliculatus]